MAHQHILGYSVPDDGVEDAIKEWTHNQGYLSTIKYKKITRNIVKSKSENGVNKNGK